MYGYVAALSMERDSLRVTGSPAGDVHQHEVLHTTNFAVVQHTQQLKLDMLVLKNHVPFFAAVRLRRSRGASTTTT
jgi:hypothetical protein